MRRRVILAAEVIIGALAIITLQPTPVQAGCAPTRVFDSACVDASGVIDLRNHSISGGKR